LIGNHLLVRWERTTRTSVSECQTNKQVFLLIESHQSIEWE
jgi:hypothetical protein